MKNIVTCPNCSSENPYYKETCSSCNSFIRDKISNLDLWNIIGLLIENPVKAFRQIIYSQHKNFIFFILFFVSIKFLINARFISSTNNRQIYNNHKFTIKLPFDFTFHYRSPGFIRMLFLPALIHQLGFSTRFKDILLNSHLFPITTCIRFGSFVSD